MKSFHQIQSDFVLKLWPWLNYLRAKRDTTDKTWQNGGSMELNLQKTFIFQVVNKHLLFPNKTLFIYFRYLFPFKRWTQFQQKAELKKKNHPRNSGGSCFRAWLLLRNRASTSSTFARRLQLWKSLLTGSKWRNRLTWRRLSSIFLEQLLNSPKNKIVAKPCKSCKVSRDPSILDGKWIENGMKMLRTVSQSLVQRKQSSKPSPELRPWLQCSQRQK